jgi:hypothetical protein
MDTVKTIMDGHELEVPARLMPAEPVKVEHTPTPWYAESHNRNNDVLVSNNEYQIALCLTHPIHFKAQANAEFIVTACNAHGDLVAKLDQVASWLERLAADSEQQAKDTRFSSLAEACAADAKNYRATAKDIRAALRKAGVN